MLPDDERYMRRAIEIARRGAGYVSPNPMVGAVLVHNGRIIGEGWHAAYGGLHAEAACLGTVAEADRQLVSQSTMYVTLEPCAHQGRQPPCAHRLVAEGIPRVVVGASDPFPQVSGRGISIIREAGISVTEACCIAEARWLCRRFLQVQERHRPYVILKWAQSADGYFAPSDGRRYQLSNTYSQTLVHQWRTQESAMLIGYNTALTDNPQLTSRAWAGPQPLRIALDRRRQLPRTHHLFDGATPTWIVCDARGEDDPAYLQLPFDNQLLPQLLKRIADIGKNSVIVEGGAQLLNSFIEAGLWDEARVFETPVRLGQGIAAPLLTNATEAFTTAVESDRLSVYLPAGTPYAYPPGAVL